MGHFKGKKEKKRKGKKKGCEKVLEAGRTPKAAIFFVFNTSAGKEG